MNICNTSVNTYVPLGVNMNNGSNIVSWVIGAMSNSDSSGISVWGFLKIALILIRLGGSCERGMLIQ